MLNLKQQTIKAKTSDESINEFSGLINKAYPFVLHSIKENYAQVFSSCEPEKKIIPQISDSDTLAAGDIFLKESSVLFYLIPKSLNSITIGEISPDDSFANLAEFSAKVEEALAGANITSSKKWEETKIEESITNSLKEASHEVKFDKNELKATSLLEDKFSYSVLKEIFDKKHSSVKNLIDAFGQDNKEKIEKLLENFEKANLINKDYVILCRKSNQQILQVSSKQAIEETSQSMFKCFICGNPIASEEIDEIITCSDFGKKLLINDFWLLIKLLNYLDTAKIKRENIYIEADTSSLQKVFIKKNEKLILVVICNRKLELNDSYHLSSLINTFCVPFVILVSPNNLTYLMKSYLVKNSPESEFIFIEDLHSFEKEINSFFENFDKSLLVEVFEEFNNLTYIDLKNAILGKFAGTGEDNYKKETLSEKPKSKSKK